jgi:hypothetical protein
MGGVRGAPVAERMGDSHTMSMSILESAGLAWVQPCFDTSTARISASMRWARVYVLPKLSAVVSGIPVCCDHECMCGTSGLKTTCGGGDGRADMAVSGAGRGGGVKAESGGGGDRRLKKTEVSRVANASVPPLGQ